VPVDPVYLEHVAVEVYVGAAWYELEDVQLNPGIQIQRGMSGTSMLDRVASPGSMTFQLDNSEGNSVGLLGYYSRNNVNCMSGWDIGIPIRCRATFLGVAETLFIGTVEAIEPQSGKYRERKVNVHCVDWMQEASEGKIKGLTLQTNCRSDQLLAALLALTTKPPVATLIDYGADTYPYAFDNVLDSEQSLLSIIQTIEVCEQGYAFVLRDGTFVGQSRHRRPNVFTVSETFTDEDIFEVDATRGREEIINTATAVSHPRHVDATALTVLYVCPDAPNIPRGVTQDFNALYRDPLAKATRVGCVTLTPPVATTDFLFNSLASGLGTNLISQLTVTVLENAGQGCANSATIRVVNNGPQDGFLTLLQLRGKGIYDYNTSQVTVTSAASAAKYGGNDVTVDMPHQADAAVASDVAAYIIQQCKALLTQIKGFTYWGNQEARLMLAALTLDIGTKIGLSETVVGTAGVIPPGETQPVSVLDFFIQSVNLQITEGRLVKCSYGIAPADPFTYWVLERTGYTELDLTTRLASGTLFAGWIVGQSSLDTDTRVNA